jgi:acyl-CoA dehydrogenase
MGPADAARLMADFARRHVAGRALWRASDLPPDLWPKIAQVGLFRIGLPDGGYAAIAAAGAALAELGGVPGLASIWTGRQLVARFMIQGFADDRQRAAWMPALTGGALTACVAISEPRAGAHPKHLTTTATSAGDAVRLDGTKAWVSSANLADLVIVFAISRRDGERKRYSAYAVPRGTPGLTLTEDRDSGALRPSRHLGLRLDGCIVPAINRLGPPDTAFEAMAIPFRDIEDAVGAAGMVGTFRHLLHRLAAATPTSRHQDAAAPMGALAAIAAIAAETAATVAASLDTGVWRPGAPPPALAGLRLLCEDLLAGMRGYRADFASAHDDAIEVLFADTTLLLDVAKRARAVKQNRIGMALLRQAQAVEQRGAEERDG